MKRTWKTCIFCKFAVLETSKQAAICFPFVGYHEKSRASSTRSERRRARDSEWPIELSLSRLCRATHSRVLSRLASLATRNEELTRGLRCWRRNWFPLPHTFWGVLWWLWANRKIISLLAVQSMLVEKKILLFESLTREDFFSHLFRSTKLAFCPYFKICGFIYLTVMSWMMKSNFPSANTPPVSV